MHHRILQDIGHKEVSYRGLAGHYLLRGDAWLAVHAQTLSDVYAAARVSATHPSEMSNGRGMLIAEALKRNRALKRAKSPLAAVTAARQVISDALTDTELQAWKEQINDLSLFGSEKLDSSHARALREYRLEGMSPDDFVEAREEKADACYLSAANRREAGDTWGAITATYDGDLSLFEAWLVHHSMEIGDKMLVQAEFKWQLATLALEDLGSLPENDEKRAAKLVRSRLAWAAGPNNAQEIAELFSTLR